MGSNHPCWAVINVDFALKKMKNIIHKSFGKSGNTLKKKKRLIRHIAKDLEIASEDSDEE